MDLISDVSPLYHYEAVDGKEWNVLSHGVYIDVLQEAKRSETCNTVSSFWLLEGNVDHAVELLGITK